MRRDLSFRSGVIEVPRSSFVCRVVRLRWLRADSFLAAVSGVEMEVAREFRLFGAERLLPVSITLQSVQHSLVVSDQLFEIALDLFELAQQHLLARSKFTLFLAFLLALFLVCSNYVLRLLHPRF